MSRLPSLSAASTRSPDGIKSKLALPPSNMDFPFALSLMYSSRWRRVTRELFPLRVNGTSTTRPASSSTAATLPAAGMEPATSLSSFRNWSRQWNSSDSIDGNWRIAGARNGSSPWFSIRSEPHDVVQNM
jgi:hypothetical protein